MPDKIDKLIINSPYEEPKLYWKYDRATRSFNKEQGRRPAGYVVASESSRSFDDPGRFIEIPLVNQIRPRIKEWRENGYPGVTGITKRLLEHWYDRDQRQFPFFFCQLEAIETLIWLTEADPSSRVGIDVPSDGGLFQRLCSKMGTGTGKTVVMAMLIAWQVINKATYPQDARFSKHVFVVAPGLTVKKRLQVLYPTNESNNYYEEFSIVPLGLMDKLRQGKVLVRNWHALSWDTEERINKRRSVDKRGAMSDEAYVRMVLQDLCNTRNIIIINDEAHHAWRVPAESKVKGVSKEEQDEATIWVSGLDRIHNARGIQTCYDFSATPFAPTGKQTTEESLYGWIVSDFGLNDAIESGLVKTPRVVVRDDSWRTPDYLSSLYHIYNDDDVKADLNRKAQQEESLPDLVRNAYMLLGDDWRETAKEWKKIGYKTPPVMISVANRTETAARINYSFVHKDILIEELCDPQRLLHIDSKVLEKAEMEEEPVTVDEEADEVDENGEEERAPKKQTKKQYAEDLRNKVDTVGKIGKPGEQIQNVISVGMLSEGWDAKTVTHIMGLRAFSSQLLCEQVVGRGLRRTSYELNAVSGLFDADYVNIFGVPFTFLPHESTDGPPPPPQPKTRIEPDDKKREYEITFPNIIRIDHTYKPLLSLDLNTVDTLVIDAYKTPTIAQLAPVIAGKPDFSKLKEIDLEKLAKEYRLQRIIFETARNVFDTIKGNWKGNREYLLAQVIHIVERFIESDRIEFVPELFRYDELKRRILLALNMTRIINYIGSSIRFENTELIVPIFDDSRPVRSTGDMQAWYTGKPCEHTNKSHINLCTYDSRWEASETFEFDHNKNVAAWVKNDHIGFQVYYFFRGVVKKYFPDFIIKLIDGSFVVLEVKGQESDEDIEKRKYLNEWVQAVNQHGGFGKWRRAISYNPADIKDIIETSQ
ncbi:MAG: DEAD/DEAH box helicase family protein [Deltaproteobacteria bacterium]|nr:DEAD/DEAH box helicase family protein [Candidatus Zymogenaceae bacterium]